LNPLPRQAGARIVAAKFLKQFNLTVANAAQAAFNLRFAREAAPSLGSALESMADVRNRMD
jgi:hypothetical protein